MAVNAQQHDKEVLDCVQPLQECWSSW